MTLSDDRRLWEEQALQSAIPNDIDLLEEDISGVPCLWVKPSDAENNKVVLYLHGGGLVSGSIITHRNFAASLAKITDITVLLVGYRLLPENPFPAPLDDAVLVYKSLVADKAYASDEIILGGDSSGGALALSTLIQLRDAQWELPDRAFVISGAFDMTLSSTTMQLNSGRDTLLNYDDLVQWRDNYIGREANSPMLSPLFAGLSLLPPILLLAGEHELWLGDSVRITEKIEQCKGTVQLIIWEAMSHVWALDTDNKESRKTIEAIRTFIQNK